MRYMITKREIAFSVIIVIIMLAISIPVYSLLKNHLSEEEQRYLSALQIDNDKEQFEYAMKTNFGDSLVYGNVVADGGVSFSEINGLYTAINRYREDYNMHTRVVTYTDSKGNVHSRTEVYYSWDLESVDRLCVENVYFLGKLFDIDIFNFNNFESLNISGLLNASGKHNSRYYYIDNDSRYYYNVIPLEFSGTLFSYLGDNTIVKTDYTEFKAGENISEFIESKSNFNFIISILFWILWIAITAGVVALFYYFENNWLEDRRY